MKAKILSLLLLTLLLSCKNEKKENTLTTPKAESTTLVENKKIIQKDSIAVTPIEHASFVMQLGGKTFYVDPVGSPDLYKDFSKPDFIVITDIHGDHFSVETLEKILTENVQIVAPEAVAEKMPKTLQDKTWVMYNGDLWDSNNINFEAIPMYNLREEAKQFHPKGRGNGYVISAEGKRVYISGDTENTLEMRNLKNIDVAFVCMNLPYTMPIEMAADGVLSFNPKKVYPYHYRGTEGMSDVAKFKELVQKTTPKIDVQLLNWYPN